MIKMLLVDSEDDYGALDFDKGNATIHEAYQLAEDSGGYYETDDGIEYKSYTFKEVDKVYDSGYIQGYNKGVSDDRKPK